MVPTSEWKLQWAGVSLPRKGVFLEGALMGWTLTFHNADQRESENPKAPLSRAPNDRQPHPRAEMISPDY